MDMGTAKTRVLIERIVDLVRAPHIEERCVLILCPKAVVDTWSGQIDEWMQPNDRQEVLVTAARKGAVAQRLKLIERGDKSARRAEQVHVVAINYEATRSAALRTWLKKTAWSLIICDESHAIKAHDSKVSKFVATLEAVQRVCLTGTPTPHSPLDWFGQMRFLAQSDEWNRFVPFRARYAVQVPLGASGIKKIVGYKNLDELERRIAPYVFRVRAEDVLTLPGVQHVRRAVTLSPNERKAYDGIFRELFALVDDGVALAANNVLDRLLKCQQITGGSVQITDEDDGTKRRVEIGTTKRDELAQLFSEMPENEPVVVFARFIADLDQIAAASSDAGRGHLELSGRMNHLAEWKAADGGEVLGVQIQSGGAGVDLTRASRVVYWSVGHSLGDYLQSLARAHRPGQTRDVQYFHLVARDTIDEAIYRALAERRDLVEESLAHVQQLADSRRRPVGV